MSQLNSLRLTNSPDKQMFSDDETSTEQASQSIACCKSRFVYLFRSLGLEEYVAIACGFWNA